MITTTEGLSTKILRRVYKRLNIAQFGRCVLCGSPSGRGMDLCVPCEGDLPRITAACHRCAIPLPASETQPLCGQCLSTKPPQTCAIALYAYDFPIDQLISQMKFSRQMKYARVLGQLLAQRLVHYYAEERLPDAIIPVPLSRQRLQERGFNQASLLAKPVAKALNIPLLKFHCVRSRHTEAQSGLGAKTRRDNVRNAFALRKPLVDKQQQGLQHIALVDDVMTTGATLESLAKTLLQHGIERLDFWTIARTPD